MKTINPNAKPFIVAFLFFVILLLVIFLSSCNQEKKIARLDQKAVNRVNAKEPLVEQVANQYFKTHPQLTNDSVRVDSSFTVIHDTVSKVIKVPYIVYKQKVIDTIINGVSIFADSTGITIKILEINTKQTNTKTTETTKQNISTQYRLTDSINKYKLIIEGLIHDNAQLEKVSLGKDVTIKSKEKDINFANMRFWLAIGTLVGIVILLIYLKIKSLPTSLFNIFKK